MAGETPTRANVKAVIINTVKTVQHNFFSGAQDRIGLFIASRCCVIGEYAVYDKDLASEKWSEEITYEDYPELENKLSDVIKKRYLYNRVISISLSTPEVYTTCNFDYDQDIEEQNILPKGIEWDTIDYTIRPGTCRIPRLLHIKIPGFSGILVCYSH